MDFGGPPKTENPLLITAGIHVKGNPSAIFEFVDSPSPIPYQRSGACSRFHRVRVRWTASTEFDTMLEKQAPGWDKLELTM
jgi:hypothetical protein